ncbi:putative transcription factor protein [Eutypa lata UCREL1]|uniref:Putative transcription factor protein n=1 Tax=Eutypa lata (strain UCR-EL1) TaxID=1287681 RepID=M7SZE3_EUTLA|nr:putative transcription factor protein [Eutypa lata UCREL1]
MFRGRKQVSSHIQVLKAFFQALPTFNFLFPGKQDVKDDAREEDDTESFKHNKVLIAIASGCLPDEQPNYAYFAQLLGADKDVRLKPKQCWIYVSSSEVALTKPTAGREGGTARKQMSGYDKKGNFVFGEADYPHVRLNAEKDYQSLPGSSRGETSILLHEYTRSLAQKESCSQREIIRRWRGFPRLLDMLERAMEDTRPSDENTSRCVMGPCDTFHLEMAVDLHSNAKFPDGSHCNGIVELSITRPDLMYNHAWRSVTTVCKPKSLYLHTSDAREEEYSEKIHEIEAITMHRTGCNPNERAINIRSGLNPCDCAARGLCNTIAVNFPACSWSKTFVMLAKYQKEACEEREQLKAIRRRKEELEKARIEAEGSQPHAVEQESNSSTRASSSSHKKSSSSRKKASSSSQKKASTTTSPPPSPPPATPKKDKLMDLLRQVAMYQEIWSAAPPGPDAKTDEKGVPKRQWTRRAVLLWTFVPVQENTDEKGKTTVVSAGTNWRFVSKLDPSSQYHQRRAQQSRESHQAHRAQAQAQANREAAMSPGLAYAQHAQAAMQDPYGAATAPTAAIGGYDSGSGGGLATPPPTANLQSSAYGQSFGRSARGSIAGSSVSNSSVDGGSVVGPAGNSGSGLHHHPFHHLQQQQHHHHHHQPQSQNMSFMSDNTGTCAAESQDSTLVGVTSAGADSFLSDLGVPHGVHGVGSFGDEVGSNHDTDADLQAWAAHNNMHGLLVEDTTPWAPGPPATSWADTRALAAAATHQHQQQQQQQQQQHWESLSYGGEDSQDNTIGSVSIGAVEPTLWSSPLGGSPHHHQHQQHHHQQQQPQITPHQDQWAPWHGLEDAGDGQPWDDDLTSATHNTSNTAAAADGNDLLLGGGGSTGLTPLRSNLKRARDEDEDEDDDGSETRYPVSSVRRRKLTHGAAPTADMDEGEYQL